MRRDDLDDLVLVTERKEVLGRSEVQSFPIIAGKRVVRDLLDEVLQESVLTALWRERIRRERDDLLPHQRGEHRLHVGFGETGDGRETPRGECSAEHCGLLDGSALVRGEAVEPRGDERMQGLWNLECLDLPLEPIRVAVAHEDAAIEQHADGLDCVEGNTLGPFEYPRAELLREPWHRLGQ